MTRSSRSPAAPAEVSSGPSAAPSNQGRFEELEAFRGLAALLIVVFHAYQFARYPGPEERFVYSGQPVHVLLVNLEAVVAWFFVLSGFLVFLPFARAAIWRGRPDSARGFLIRRAIRILPAYYVAILVVWTARYTGGSGQWTDLFEHLTFTHIFDRRHVFWTIGPAWSLAVEVLFYVFLAGFGPLVYLLCGRFDSVKARIGVLVGLLALMAAGSASYKWWAWSIAGIPESNYPAYFGPLAKLDTLAFGMLLAVAAVVLGREWIGRTGALALGLAGLGLTAAAFGYRERFAIVDLYFHTLAAAGFVAVVAASVFGSLGWRWNRALASSVLRWLGLISYSVYLWHEPIMLELSKRGILIVDRPPLFLWNAGVLALLSIAAGVVCYWALEYPTMQARHLFTREGRLAKRYQPLPSGAPRTERGPRAAREGH
jgi:peptidoglycan/LPS O-acetylase OafA/YrhL